VVAGAQSPARRQVGFLLAGNWRVRSRGNGPFTWGMHINHHQSYMAIILILASIDRSNLLESGLVRGDCSRPLWLLRGRLGRGAHSGPAEVEVGGVWNVDTGDRICRHSVLPSHDTDVREEARSDELTCAGYGLSPFPCGGWVRRGTGSTGQRKEKAGIDFV
jgi:hypothetical protein